MESEYTAIHGLMQLLKAQNNSPADGTGIMVLVDQAHNLLGRNIPPVLTEYTLGLQPALFGGYPDKSDIVPSAIFVASFLILMFGHLFIFFKNYSRGHYFYISLSWVVYCMMRIVGFALRIVWAKDITNTRIGITSEIFLILPSEVIVSFNLILAQRIFTWRHPVGGSRKLFWGVMIQLYVVVVLVIVMTIIFQSFPSIYLLSPSMYVKYQKVVQASSILIILYSLTAIALLALAYFFKPTKKDENLYTYQPWWIESFSPFYFVKKGAANEAAATFMKRTRNHRHAIRVIAATHHHHNMVEGLSNDRGGLSHNYSLAIILVTTLFIFIGSVGRAVALFENKYKKDQGAICHPVVMYICWGLLEVIINLLYLIGRVDLRFYRPDRLPLDVRSIITAEQSLYQSETGTMSEYDVDSGSNSQEYKQEKVHKETDSEFVF
ncbi:hypothetical protein CAAN1_06S05600 [[Candida] anglica]|uniref:Uncharacterized protein n=1 Tax=[Candida] anglica TaxID=148631 RepID=A0ABP0EL22_9ASCO